MAAQHPEFEPIMARPATPATPIVLPAAVFGAVLILSAIVAIGQGLYLNSHGTVTQAEVVAAQTRHRGAFLRVRIPGPPDHEVNLWAWQGSPTVGQTMTVVYDAKHDWAKDARTFVPWWRLGIGVPGLVLLCGPLLVDRWMARRRYFLP
jgi:hypothetical protein